MKRKKINKGSEVIGLCNQMIHLSSHEWRNTGKEVQTLKRRRESIEACFESRPLKLTPTDDDVLLKMLPEIFLLLLCSFILIKA